MNRFPRPINEMLMSSRATPQVKMIAAIANCNISNSPSSSVLVPVPRLRTKCAGPPRGPPKRL